MSGSTIVVAVITIQWVMLAVGAVAGGGGGGLIDPISALELSAEVATGVDSLSTDGLTLDDRMLEWVNNTIYETDKAGGRLVKCTLKGSDGAWIYYEAKADQTYYGGPGSHEKLLDNVSRFKRAHTRF